MNHRKATKHKLYLQYESTSSGGQRTSNDPYSDRTPEYINIVFKGLVRGHGSGFFPCGEEISVSEEHYNAPQLYLVIVRHTVGDSFGTSHGRHYVAGVFTEAAEARNLARKIDSGEFLKENEDKYFPWGGYYERLENVEVHCFKVRGGDDESGDDDCAIQYHD
jgi:hypothetical protein